MVKSLDDYSNDELRSAGDIIVVMREHFLYDKVHPYNEITSPVALCKLAFLKFIMLRLKADACDLFAVNFYWHYASTLDNRILDAVKAHLQREDEIHGYLRCLAHTESKWL